MKLGDIYIQCKKNYDAVARLGITDIGKGYQITELKKGRVEFDDLSHIECLKEPYNNFMKIIKDKFTNTSYISSDEVAIEYESRRTRLLSAMECIIKMCEEIGLNTRKTIGLDIKFPMNGNFTDFRKNIDELDFVLTKCPFFQHEKERLQFDNVDVGSFWLTFMVVGVVGVGTSVLLNNIAAFIDKCIIIRSHYLTIEMQKAELEKAKIDQNTKEEVSKGIDRVYKIMVDNAINELEEITKCDIKDGDERGRAEQSLEKMVKLIDKGLQIYVTIDAPKETKALFEPLEMHYLEVSNKIKLLEKKSKESEDENS